MVAREGGERGDFTGPHARRLETTRSGGGLIAAPSTASQCRWRASSRSIPWSRPCPRRAARQEEARRKPSGRRRNRAAFANAPAPLGDGPVTTAALPVHQPPCSTIPSLPDPELLGLFFT